MISSPLTHEHGKPLNYIARGHRLPEYGVQSAKRKRRTTVPAEGCRGPALPGLVGFPPVCSGSSLNLALLGGVCRAFAALLACEGVAAPVKPLSPTEVKPLRKEIQLARLTKVIL